MSLSIKCKHCKRKVPANSRIKNHQYCNLKPCQNARKAKWQRQKMSNDPTYRQGQEDSNDAWLQKNPDYWKNYRKNNPKYSQRNRELQKQRDRKRRENNLEMDASKSSHRKMDASKQQYLIIPVSCIHLAKMDNMDFR